MKNKSIYKRYYEIKNRCNNPKNLNYKNYGQRGIKMYNIWENSYKDFENYVLSLGKTLDDILIQKLSIDRIDNNKGYFPGNIQWSNHNMQMRNRGKFKNSNYNYVGVSKDTSRSTKKHWSARININKKSIRIGWFFTEIEAVIARNNYIINNNLVGFTLNNILKQDASL